MKKIEMKVSCTFAKCIFECLLIVWMFSREGHASIKNWHRPIHEFFTAHVLLERTCPFLQEPQLLESQKSRKWENVSKETNLIKEIPCTFLLYFTWGWKGKV